MKKTVLRYGLFSAITIVILFTASWFIFRDSNFEAQEVFGYTSMVLSLLFVFFGIKHYRDKENGGQLTFGQGMKVGLLIVLIPALIFGIFDIFYTTVLNPGFLDRYYTAEVAKMQQSLSASEFQAAKAELDAEKEMFSKPGVAPLVMFLTVFIIGVIVTVISSLILKRNTRG
jgi:hypothetical protein